jgi:hypothetical protein
VDSRGVPGVYCRGAAATHNCQCCAICCGTDCAAGCCCCCALGFRRARVRATGRCPAQLIV